jgi:hypothetical protein
MQSAIHEADDFESAIEACHLKGWTDGLPVIPPTPDRVERMIAASGLAEDTQIGFYELRQRPVTVEKLAINAVMAGCLPEHFPVVMALTECILDPGLQLHTASSSTGNISLGFVVNGPIRHRLGMNCHGNVLGPGNRATSSIGRALRFVQVNVMGSVGGAGSEPGHGRPVLDRSTMGSPLRYACFHVVENEEAFPSLTPMHVMRGFDRQDSVVSAFAMVNYVIFSNHAEQTPDAWLDSLAHYLVGAGRLFDSGYGILLVPPEPAAMFVAEGWSKRDIANALFHKASRSTAWVKRNGWKIGGRFERGGPVEPGDEQRILSVAGGPDDIHVVICGGPAGNFPAYVQTYAGNFEVVSRWIGPLAD